MRAAHEMQADARPFVTLRLGDEGESVLELQRRLSERGFHLELDGTFDADTEAAVKAYQAQGLDRRGAPLEVDGQVGPLTWWSLTHPAPVLQPAASVDFTRLPPVPPRPGLGWDALRVAVAELALGCGEEGGNNRGPHVRRYLHGLADEGSSWCAGFVSHCFWKAAGENASRMPFQYTVGARDLLRQGRKLGWARPPESGYVPQPGDVVVWWRVAAKGWQGHAGLVHHAADGFLFTIEGNHGPQVRGFEYVLSRMDQLLGFVAMPVR